MRQSRGNEQRKNKEKRREMKKQKQVSKQRRISEKKQKELRKLKEKRQEFGIAKEISKSKENKRHGTEQEMNDRDRGIGKKLTHKDYTEKKTKKNNRQINTREEQKRRE